MVQVGGHLDPARQGIRVVVLEPSQPHQRDVGWRRECHRVSTLTLTLTHRSTRARSMDGNAATCLLVRHHDGPHPLSAPRVLASAIGYPHTGGHHGTHEPPQTDSRDSEPPRPSGSPARAHTVHRPEQTRHSLTHLQQHLPGPFDQDRHAPRPRYTQFHSVPLRCPGSREALAGLTGKTNKQNKKRGRDKTKQSNRRHNVSVVGASNGIARRSTRASNTSALSFFATSRFPHPRTQKRGLPRLARERARNARVTATSKHKRKCYSWWWEKSKPTRTRHPRHPPRSRSRYTCTHTRNLLHLGAFILYKHHGRAVDIRYILNKATNN